MKYTQSLFFAAATALCGAANAAVPSGYYDACENKGGRQLLLELHSTISAHHNVGYDGLWTVYETSDVRSDGTLWDIYTTKRWSSNFKKCGNYSVIGDCVNREHSMPKSWWGGGKSEQYSDAFHLYPTDGRVNGQRSNYPYGECAHGSRLPNAGSVQALGRLGNSTFPGYSDVVFEPDDEYKGDLARSYFYMATCYNERVSRWTSGNGERMLAGNNYPVFKQWAIELLLKWHRQDPVSQKEKDRNEAIYRHQKNRNPYIDHPELAEYIWGDKKNETWTSTAATTPTLTLPADGSTLDLGATLKGVARKGQVKIKGTGLKSDVTLTVTGSAFSVSPATVSASAANSIDGATATVTFNPASTGDFTGQLKVTSGSLTRTVNLRGNAVSTIPAGPVRAIGAESFTAIWSYVGDEDASGNYTLDVRAGGSSVAGYPRAVKARDEYFTVCDLEPLTAYTYTVKSRNLTSEPVAVTTTAPTPAVELLYDEEAMLYAVAGEPSAEAEILMEASYIDTDIILTVNEPFQLSTDKGRWDTSLTLSPEDDRFYLRVFSDKAGSFFTSITVKAGSYTNDDADFNALVSAPGKPFHEDFEAENSTKQDIYDPVHSFQGTMCRWTFDNAGMWTGEGRGDSQGVRMGKNSTSTIAMDEDYPSGMGTVSLWCCQWSGSEGACTFELEYSTDGGTTWSSAGTGEVTTTDWAPLTFTVNSTAPTRLRVRQTAGKRFLLDDIEATAYSGISDAEVPDYHTWDAWCRDGRIIIETSRPGTVAHVYALDGTVIFSGAVNGTASVATETGLYIVAVDDFARRVVVR